MAATSLQERLPAGDGRARATPLAVRRLRLRDFRNYRQLDIETDARPVVLTGDNGAGKTNLLEAISLLTPGRGLRRAALGELEREGGGPWAVSALIEGRDGPVSVATGRRSESERRAIEIDGAPLRSQSELSASIGATWLTPAQDRLFMESPAARRRFLDRLVLAIDPEHARRCGAYERHLRERSSLLRQGRVERQWLEVLERRLAETGIAVAAARREVVDGLNALEAGDGPAAPAAPFPAARLAVRGMAEELLDRLPAVAAERELVRELALSRSQDALQGGAGPGPHRSDLEVVDVESDLPAASCSTGRQKSLLLGIVLAEARLRAERQGGLPVILLDEVVAHLDRRRREQLFDYLLALGAQSWLTGTDAPTFAPLGEAAQFFHVHNAVLTRR